MFSLSSNLYKLYLSKTHFCWQGEAVRLARQLPLTLAKDDVYDTLSRMKKQFGDQTKGCIHGRPFYSHLADIPQDDE